MAANLEKLRQIRMSLDHLLYPVHPEGIHAFSNGQIPQGVNQGLFPDQLFYPFTADQQFVNGYPPLVASAVTGLAAMFLH